MEKATRLPRVTDRRSFNSVSDRPLCTVAPSSHDRNVKKRVDLGDERGSRR